MEKRGLKLGLAALCGGGGTWPSNDHGKNRLKDEKRSLDTMGLDKSEAPRPQGGALAGHINPAGH